MHLKNRQLWWENSPWCCRRGRQRLSQVKTSTQMVVGHSFCLLPHMWKRAKKFCFPESGQQESGMRSKWKLGQPLTRNLFTIWHQAPISGHQELINYSRVLFIEIKRSSENPVHTQGPSAAMTHYWNRGYRGATEREQQDQEAKPNESVDDWWSIMLQQMSGREEEVDALTQRQVSQYLSIEGVLLMELRCWAAHHQWEEGPRCEEDQSPRCHLCPPLSCCLKKQFIKMKIKKKLKIWK